MLSVLEYFFFTRLSLEEHYTCTSCNKIMSPFRCLFAPSEHKSFYHISFRRVILEFALSFVKTITWQDIYYVVMTFVEIAFTHIQRPKALYTKCAWAHYLNTSLTVYNSFTNQYLYLQDTRSRMLKYIMILLTIIHITSFTILLCSSTKQICLTNRHLFKNYKKHIEFLNF